MSADPTLIASDPARSAWVAANAGAGKTHTLANRVARLLLAGASPARILCLTYTKAASAEMQGRLFDRLGAWSMLPDEALAARIAEIGAESGGPEQLRQARRLFAQALETPGGLKILTIHAFCQSVLARFPIEAGISPAFEVLDEASARALIAAARQAILERAGSGDARLAAALAHLVSETGEAQLHSLLDAALGNDRRKLDRFFGASGAEDIARAVYRAHGAREGEGPESVAREFCESLRGEASLREIADWLATGSDKDRVRAAVLCSLLAGAPDAFTQLGDIFLTGKGTRYKSLASAKLVKARGDLAGALDSVAERFLAAEERRRAARSASLAEAALAVIDAVRRDYARAKHLRGALDYDDLIIETRRLLEKRDASAWVLYKLDGGVDHILIDEAQDTSSEQWAIVRKLTEEFFAGESSRTRTLFAVGDEKQSIFSFQGAEPAQFDANRNHFRKLAEAAAHDFADAPLRTSRRSAPDILAFIDAVFADEAARAGLSAGGAPIRHDAFRAEAKGRIEFWPSLKPDEAVEIDYYRPVDVESQTSPVMRLARRIAGEIKGWIARGARLPGHKRPIEPGDIMILLPRREPFGSEIIRQLKLQGIAVAGADRIALAEQIAAMDLVALGRFVLLPDDDLNLAALLRSPLAGLSEEELFSLCHDRKGGLWRELSARSGECASFAAAREFLADMLSRADYAPPFEFYAHALTARGKRADMLARLGADAADVIDEFLSLALDYEASITPSLESFLDWIRRGRAEIKRDMERGRNQVRVMTVHGAKGLEADIVILPDTTSLPEAPSRKGHLLYAGPDILFPTADGDAPEPVKAAKDAALRAALEEHRRLFYVALTRARDRLYICGFESKRGVKEGSWYALAEQAARAGGVKLARGGEEILVWGEMSDETGAPAAEPESARQDLPGWLVGAPPPETAPRLLRPSDFDAGPTTVSPLAESGRFRRGLLVHALLARLPEIAPGARRALAGQFLRARGVPGPEAEALIEETLAVIEDPLFSPVFGANSRAEVAVIADLPGPGRVLGRIDRLAVTGETVFLADFKTNRPPPRQEEDVATGYLAQMALYRAALARIFPGKKIACALIWTDGPLLLPLSDRILDAQMTAIAARLAGEP